MISKLHGQRRAPSGAGKHVYIFNHLPRTGGGALGEFLESIFPVVRDYPPQDKKAFLKWISSPIDLDHVPAGALIIGHYTARGGRIHERYPEALISTRYRLITMVRDPKSWVTSHLQYFCEAGDDLNDYARGLSGGMAHAFGLPNHTVAEALSRYWLVGTTALCQVLCNEIAHAVQAESKKVLTLNPSLPRFDPKLVANALQIFELGAKLDYELYDYALRLAR